MATVFPLLRHAYGEVDVSRMNFGNCSRRSRRLARSVKPPPGRAMTADVLRSCSARALRMSTWPRVGTVTMIKSADLTAPPKSVSRAGKNSPVATPVSRRGPPAATASKAER
ncbi:hypothetical protein TorRG33x02_259680 [Trema orientale]|uniref:Uncharacterized protein n=1 Tax=Trema orientale TaxID=63057 RepID=A0A2P5D768_TREOI|nr:hypothetical protein TorRG33x02_259680 [Trema orientale]